MLLKSLNLKNPLESPHAYYCGSQFHQKSIKKLTYKHPWIFLAPNVGIYVQINNKKICVTVFVCCLLRLSKLIFVENEIQQSHELIQI